MPKEKEKCCSICESSKDGCGANDSSEVKIKTMTISWLDAMMNIVYAHIERHADSAFFQPNRNDFVADTYVRNQIKRVSTIADRLVKAEEHLEKRISHYNQNYDEVGANLLSELHDLRKVMQGKEI